MTAYTLWGMGRCRCGKSCDRVGRHDAHVTEALAPVIEDMIAAHRVEALVMDDLASDEAVLLGPVDS